MEWDECGFRNKSRRKTAAKPPGLRDGSVSIGLHVQLLLGGINQKKWVRKGYKKGHRKGHRRGCRKIVFLFSFFPLFWCRIKNCKVTVPCSSSRTVSVCLSCSALPCEWLLVLRDHRQIRSRQSCPEAALCTASCPCILVQNWRISPLQQTCFDKFLISFTLMPLNETDA